MAGSGLEGIVVAQTRLSKIDGEAGTPVDGGHPIEELAEHATFGEVCHLLWSGELPTGDELAELRSLLAAEHALPDHLLGLVRSAPPDAVRSEMDQRGKKVYANADFYSASVHDKLSSTGALHEYLRLRPGLRADGAHSRAARPQPADPSEGGIRRPGAPLGQPLQQRG